MSKKAVIIGSGIGGLGTACLLAKAGYQVHVFEKNNQLGGRCNIFEAHGFRFDMGPSWYLMPDVFQNFFTLIGENIDDYLSLTKLQPSYRTFFKDDNKQVDLYSDLVKDKDTVEALEPGSHDQLKRYLDGAKLQYEISKQNFMYKNYDSVFDFINKQTMLEGSKLSVFTNMNRYVGRFFKTEEMQKIMQYPLVFLGSSPYNTPAIYTIMSHIDFNMGVFYPQGGMYQIVKSLVAIGQKNGVTYHTNSGVNKIITKNKSAVGIQLESGEIVESDYVISNADIHHTETQLLQKEERMYSETYWKKRTMAPSGFIMYIGLKDKVNSLVHHNLVFSKDWKKNFSQIFDAPQWPEDPSFYVCCPSVTDSTVAPEGKENIFVLVPIPAGLKYEQSDLEHYKEKILDIMCREMIIPDLKNRIEYLRIYCSDDFEKDYNSFMGTALGLAHTINQTAVFRPNNVSKRVKNLLYVGANTNPGIGVPICLISAELAYKRIIGDKSAAPLNKL